MEATQLMRHVQQINTFYVLLMVIFKLFENTFMLLSYVPNKFRLKCSNHVKKLKSSLIFGPFSLFPQRAQTSASVWTTLASWSSTRRTASWCRSRWPDWCSTTSWPTRVPTLRRERSQASTPSGTTFSDLTVALVIRKHTVVRFATWGHGTEGAFVGF